MKKLLISAFLITGLLTQPAFGFSDDVQLEINHKNYSNLNPILIDGRVYVPLRVVSEAMNHKVVWDRENMAVLVDSDNKSLRNVGKIQIYIKNKKLALTRETGLPFLLAEGYTFVPLRVVAEELDGDVKWLARERKVLVKQKVVVKPLSAVAPIKNETLKSLENNVIEQSPLIFSKSEASLEKINQYLKKKEAEIKASSIKTGKNFVPFPENIGKYYYELGNKYGIRGDFALAQALLETGFFQFGNEVLPEQNNFCGLGAIGRKNTEEDLNKLVFSKVDSKNAYLVVGNHGWNYRTIAIGVEAHLQHLYSYASANPLPNTFVLYDGRFNHGNRGKANYWTDLNGKWAVPGKGYGERIAGIAAEML